MNIRDLSTIITLSITLIAIIGAFWKGYLSILHKLNGFGKRVQIVENHLVSHTTDIANMKIQSQSNERDNRDVRESVGKIQGQLGELRDSVRDDRLTFITMLHNNEKNAQERNAQLQVELARIRERLDIEKMVSSMVSEIRRLGGN